MQQVLWILKVETSDCQWCFYSQPLPTCGWHNLKRMLLSFILRLQQFFRLLFETLSPSFTIHFSLLCKNIQLTENVLTPLIHLHKSCYQQWIRGKVLESSLTKVCLQLQSMKNPFITPLIFATSRELSVRFLVLYFLFEVVAEPSQPGLHLSLFFFFLDFCVDSEGDFCRL